MILKLCNMVCLPVCYIYSKTSDNGHSDKRTVHTFLPLAKGQPPNNGQNPRPQRVHYSDVPLYYNYSISYFITLC